jgi:hypothetical protein
MDSTVEMQGVAVEPEQSSDHWAAFAALPTSVMVAVPIPNFRVRDVLTLQPGCILSSVWHGAGDVPLLAGEVQFAWVEFEVTDEKLSARITRFS